MTIQSRSVLVLAVTAIAAVAGVASARAKPTVNITRGQLAVHGYDAVAYHTGGRPTRGVANFEHHWNGAIWRFATAANRDAFAGDPARYAPEFGGYCAYAVSRGYTADIDPEAWRIVDGRLFFNYSRRVQRLWEENLTGNILKGRANWPGVLEK